MCIKLLRGGVPFLDREHCCRVQQAEHNVCSIAQRSGVDMTVASSHHKVVLVGDALYEGGYRELTTE